MVGEYLAGVVVAMLVPVVAAVIIRPDGVSRAEAIKVGGQVGALLCALWTFSTLGVAFD